MVLDNSCPPITTFQRIASTAIIITNPETVSQVTRLLPLVLNTMSDVKIASTLIEPPH
jgi:hypothetical protein